MPGPTQIPHSRLGFGATGAWAKPWFSERKARRLIHMALERGIRYFDTAGFYSDGLAEERLGRALAETHHTDIAISTKVGTKKGARGQFENDFSLGAIRRDIEASLQRLGHDHIDTVYLHGPARKDVIGSAELLAELKQEGKIGHVGLCGRNDTLSFGMRAGYADTLMGPYNAFDTSQADIFAEARKAGLKTAAISPLGQGFYRRNFLVPKSLPDLWYIARALGQNREQLAMRRRGQEILKNVSPLSGTAAMLGFVLACPDVDIIFTNTTQPAHLKESCDIASRPPPGPDILAILAKLERMTE